MTDDSQAEKKHALSGETREGVQIVRVVQFVQVIDRGGVCRRDSAGHPLASAAEACRADREGRETAESGHRL
ncbi:MAG: hypothetical protein GY885_08335 [Phycisphaeraceae bacterium]|nr:hypothetical protein [Phycisphaeraceae bacterium]